MAALTAAMPQFTNELNPVLHAVIHFGALGVVEAIHCTNEITGDATNTFETDAFAIEVLFFF